jgi:glucose-6-phosphate isomerase
VTRSVPGSLGVAIDEALEVWQSAGNTTRLWARDASLWSRGDESRWLGWLSSFSDQIAGVDALTALSTEVRREAFSHALLIGMGGSSLCPEVLRMTFGRIGGSPDLRVIDSTDPGQVAAVASTVNLASTILIVSSKSGSTLEPNILLEYFYDEVKRLVGAEQVGRRFIAITDPGSSLERLAASRRFRHIVHGDASIGGRYSALSAFGMVPAAIMGIDVAQLLGRAAQMAHACSAGVPAPANPGVLLGVTLGVLARHGRDKLTILASPGISGLGAWLEQLVGESTGKNGQGIVPIDLETPAVPGQYRDDRAFVYLRLATAPDVSQDVSVAALEQAGHAVVRISVPDEYALGQEFFRWEIATAVIGALLGINPFDQPDVEASKVATRQLTDAYESSGALRERPNSGRVPAGAFRPGWGWRLRRAGGVRADERRQPDAAAGNAAPGPRPPPGGHLPGVRSALSALDRPGLQRRAQQRRVPPGDLRRCGGPSGARAQVHLRRRESRAGPRRLRRARRSRPAGAASAPRRRCRGRPRRVARGGGRDGGAGLASAPRLPARKTARRPGGYFAAGFRYLSYHAR